MEDRTISIKAARVDRGLTQEALAQRLGVDRRTVLSWENGDVEVKPITLYALAYVFDMNADYLRIPIKKLTEKPHLKCNKEEVS